MSKGKDSLMRDEYNFSLGDLGKYSDRYAEESNIVVLEPDVAAVFKNAEAVNAALREEIRRRREPEVAE